MTRERFVAAARGWIGTPYHHGQCVHGVGTDCAGLLIGAALEAGLGDYRHLQAAQPTLPPPGYLRRLLINAACVPVEPEPLCAGDILLFEIGGQEIHLALYTGAGSILHVLMTLGKVVEHPLSSGWRRRVSEVFRHLLLEA